MINVSSVFITMIMFKLTNLLTTHKKTFRLFAKHD